MPTGQGVRVTFTCVPPVNLLGIVCFQFNAVVAYVIPAGRPSPHELCVEFPVKQVRVFVTSDPGRPESTAPLTGLAFPKLEDEARPLIPSDSKSTANARRPIGTTPSTLKENNKQITNDLRLL
jgi:hypothetical protein